MATDLDEAQLRIQWEEGILRIYEGKWIAFQGNEVIDSNLDLGMLSEGYIEEIKEGKGPLFAYVSYLVRA